MVTRARELSQLERFYERSENTLTFLYGRKGCGKEKLLYRLAQGKPYFYYRARQCSPVQQLHMMENQIRAAYGIKERLTSYEDCFSSLPVFAGQKLILVIDEAQCAIKKDGLLRAALQAVREGRLYKGKVMIIVASSSIVWSENSFPELAKTADMQFDANIRLGNLSFMDIRKSFPEYSFYQAMCTYSILGGVPHYLNMWDGRASLKDNICKHILSSQGYLFSEAQDYISTELRELSCYDTILACLAAGYEKLNSLHEKTGYSRAKISVYIKNLAAFGIVGKVNSIETGGWDNVQKGVYHVIDRYTHFWFNFVYPHLSELFSSRPEEFYDKFIGPYLDEYMKKYFVVVCREYLQELNSLKTLPIHADYIGTWIGKEASIDIVAADKAGETMAGMCNLHCGLMPYSYYKDLLKTLKKAKINPKVIYFFSVTGFDDQLLALAKKNKSIVLKNMTEV